MYIQAITIILSQLTLINVIVGEETGGGGGGGKGRRGLNFFSVRIGVVHVIFN